MRTLTLILLVLLALLQYPLWFGKGSWLQVWQYTQTLQAEQKRNDYFRQRNDTLRAEVLDLKQGQSAIEERARSELGMIKQDEVFFQVIESAPQTAAKATESAPAAAHSAKSAKQ